MKMRWDLWSWLLVLAGGLTLVNTEGLLFHLLGWFGVSVGFEAYGAYKGGELS